MTEERWFDRELATCRLGDGRLDGRLRELVARMEVGFGESIPPACQDWAGTKAAYRFFSNDRVSEEDILRGHFDATQRRFAASAGPILVLHDTTEFSWRRKRPGQGGPRPPAHGLRAADAREPGGDDGRAALGDGRGQVLEPQEVQGYAMRWKIEVFHKILKSGCRAEQARLRTAERLVRLLAVFCILSWRVFWLTMLNRAEPDLEPALVLTDMETTMLDRLVPDPAHDLPVPRTLSLYLTKIARLGGYLARAKDPPPGNIVMWRGLSRLNDITLGATLQAEIVGN